MRPLIRFSIFSSLLLILACSSKTISPLTPSTKAYIKTIKSWQAERVAAITSPDGWLSLVGLYWLKEGRSPFGASPANTIVFPKNTPDNIGSFLLLSDKVSMEIEPKVPVLIEGKTPKKVTLMPDVTGTPTISALGTLNWVLIKRANRFGVRLRDSNNAAIKSFKGIPTFPINQKWQIPAHLKPDTIQKYVTLKNVVEMDVQMKLEGYLVFEVNGTTYELEAMDGGKEAYFIIFADETTGVETYGSGRYLYVPKVDETGKTMIDFNKAYNPPCAFTDFATCPLPSANNRLDLSISVGEMTYH